MTRPTVTLTFLGLLLVSLIAIAAFVGNKSFAHSTEFNSPPVANNDSYTVHGVVNTIGPLLQNDFDPDGDTMSASIVTFPSHGQLTGLNGNSFSYRLNVSSFTGTDSFTYRTCAAGACSGAATVTLTIVNQAPVVVSDSYTVHGGTHIGPMLANDSDPDGDQFNWVFDTPPSHGSVQGLPFPTFPSDMKLYGPDHGYTGPDSFTYKACDQLGLCSAPTTVNLNVVNQPPTLGADEYVVRGTTNVGPFKVNDSDPEGDTLGGSSLVTPPVNGSLLGLPFPTFPEDVKQYVPNAGFSGTDTFVYRVCDHLGACSTATVTLLVEGEDGKHGVCRARKPAPAPKVVGEPVDVTTGNVYLQQTDYDLPGAGHNINVQRTYNSRSTKMGLFGKAWSNPYDESLHIYDPNFIRLNEPDGRATYFKRITGSVFAPLEGDFHGQLTQTAGGYNLSMIDGTIHQFNSTGRLLSLSDANGNLTSLQYNLSGKLSSVTDPFGRVLSFLINLNGRVTSIADSTGIIADYTYGGGGELLTVTYADNSGYTFAYDGALRLTSVTDKLGNVLEAHAYDGQSRATTSQKHGGVELYTLNYVSTTQTDVTDALGRVTKYFFDASKGRNVVTSIEGVCCGGGGSQVRTWTYDSNFNVTQTTDGLGQAQTYTYDSDGNVLTVADATGTVTYTYNAFGQVLTRTDQMSGVTTNTYSPTGNLLTTKDALNNTTTFTYDSHGQLLTVTDARNKTTTLTWDTSGRLTQVKDALNNEANFAYDLRGRVTSATNALSHVTSYEYDAGGRLQKVIYPDTNFVQFTYDLAGRRTKVRDTRGNDTTFAYDGAYRLTSVTDALNHTTTYGYDLMSNRTSTTDALSRVTDYEYDDFNRLKKIIYPPAFTGSTRLQESNTYDAAGNVTKRTDTAGRDTTFTYDSVNRLTQVTDPALQVTQFQYNARSQRTAVIDALSQQYSFGYDPLGRLTQSTRGGTSITYTHDAVGNLTQRTDHNNAVTTYAYDNLNRLTTINYPDSTTATYGYDALSRLTSAANQHGTVTFVYDSRDRLTSTTDVWGQTIGYAYDANGNRTAMTFGGSAYTSYQYDVINRLTTLTDNLSQTFTYNYDVVNRLTSRVAPNGVTTSFTYDGLDRLFELSHTKSPATLGIHQYGYSTASNLTSWLGSSGNRSFNYDNADRLISVLKMGANESYGYDAVGNRTSSHLSSSYTYQPFNKLTSTTSATYTYDNNGDQLTKADGSGTRTLTWDPEDRLKQVTLPGGLTTTYNYDALGRRIQRTTSTGADERYVYDRQDVVADLNSSSTVTTSYINGPGIDDHLRQTNTTTGVSYFLTDHLGTTAALTDSSGNVVETLSYDSFGNNAGSPRTRYTYTGRERDPDTGLLYYRARYYDPGLGRFISEDPIGLQGGINTFTYVSNNPANRTDPSGLYEIDVHYYLTLYLAMRNGCFTFEEAKQIAEGNQNTDDDGRYAPGARKSYQNSTYHALHSDNHGAYLSSHWRQATAGAGSLEWLGRYLHYLQDMYSHSGYTDTRWGHSPVSIVNGNKGGTHATDKTDDDVVKSRNMVVATWTSLRMYASVKKCKCQKNWTPDMWPTINDFLNASGGGPIGRRWESIENLDPALLDRKIRILGLPRR
jgi:RHS repeat-associated protein